MKGKKTIKVTVTYEYYIQVDETNYIVQEYDDTNSLVDDLVSYRFNSVLPVISDGGVEIIDIETTEYEFTEQE